MFAKKEFYFIRHGQTDYNLLEGKDKGDHPEDIPLNQTGRAQAESIEPLISTLPVKTVCSSPLKRVQETKEIITFRLQADHKAIEDLGECNAAVWREMSRLGMYSAMPEESIARNFMDRVQRGVQEALSHPGPILIVAHGGIHWSLCCFLGIQDHIWAIHNCIPVHFYQDSTLKWRAKKLP